MFLFNIAATHTTVTMLMNVLDVIKCTIVPIDIVDFAPRYIDK